MKRNYENALRLLDSRRRKMRPKEAPAFEDIHPNGGAAPTFRGTPSLVGMRQWLEFLGHSDQDVNNLNVIHVAGTKGKGSTCAFTRSFLRVHGSRTGFPFKVGMYTSPDLRCIRERIQINEGPIDEERFTKYFFEVWDRLFSQQDITGRKEKTPRFLQLLALLALHTFIREEVQATIYETHNGGEYDATNVVQEPIVTGITSIGMDHIAQLGPTIENIAWHKAGIFKSRVPAFSAPQDPAVLAVLRSRAEEKGVELKFVDIDPSLPISSQALQAPVQRVNCSLALALVRTFLERKASKGSHHLTQQDVTQGVEEFSWPGRFEIIEDGSNKWFLDGAHNELSIKQAAEWFSKIAAETQRTDGVHPLRILIYTHFSEERDGVALLEALADALVGNAMRPQYVIFTTYQERLDGTARMDKTLKTPEAPFPDFPILYFHLWAEKDPEAIIVRQDSIEGALNFAKNIGKQHNGMETLVTGSLHLIGGALNLLRPLD